MARGHDGGCGQAGPRAQDHGERPRQVSCDWLPAGHVTSPPPVIGQGAVPGQPAAEPPVGHQPRGAEDRGGAQPGGHGEDSDSRHTGRV